MTNKSTSIQDAPKPFDIAGFLMAYEQGDATAITTLEGFAHLIRTRHAWSLQGHYGRTAAELIDLGLIDPEGAINWDAWDAAQE